jgi:hypothetical protein
MPVILKPAATYVISKQLAGADRKEMITQALNLLSKSRKPT